jgi:SAM-dependent methyltransferase
MLPERAVAGVISVDWRDVYLRARDREGRLLHDAAVATLPDLPRHHPLRREWQLRDDSSARLLADLRKRRRPLAVIDLGCGNGWLANRIAAIAGCRVVGVDVNAVELGQARRVFGERAGLRFIEHDILDAPLPVEAADIVVLASVIQYVPQPADLIARLLNGLRPGGEVHVIDSPLYQPAGLAGARTRTLRHYAEIGVPEMASAYHHHAWTAFDSLAMEVLYRPESVVPRVERRWLRRARSPFPWLRFVRQVDRS